MDRKTPDTAVILAGGFGTRLKRVVDDVPKPMAPVKGKPFLEYVLRYWKDQGIRQFVLSVGYKGHCIREYFQNSFDGCSVDYVYDDKPLGTGGAVLRCQEFMGGSDPYLLLNGDTFFMVDLDQLCTTAGLASADWCIALFATDRIERFMSLQLDEDGYVQFSVPDDSNQSRRSKAEFSPVGSRLPAYHCNGGVYLLNPMALENLPFDLDTHVSLEDEIIPWCAEKGQKIVGHVSGGEFIDIGTPADYARSQFVEYLSD